MGSLVLLGAAAVGFLEAKPPASREKAQELFRQGNYKDAYDGYRALRSTPRTTRGRSARTCRRPSTAWPSSGAIDEVDDFREAVIAAHKGNWRLLQAAAEIYLNDAEHYGFIVAGKFHRGQQRGGGRYVGYLRARPGPRPAAPGPGAGSRPSRRRPTRRGALLPHARPGAPDERPDGRRVLAAPEPDAPRRRCPTTRRAPYRGHAAARPSAAPVDADGTPVYYHVPQELPGGQERRRALALGAGPGRRGRTRACSTRPGPSSPASCSASSASRRSPRSGLPDVRRSDGRPEDSGIFALHTLKDDETIARLATGIKRFTLPDEFNPIKIYQADRRRARGPATASTPSTQLAPIFENRRQFDRAAEYLERSQGRVRRPNTALQAQRLDQIVGNWGRFEPTMTQPAGPGGDGRLPLPQRPAASTSRPTRSCVDKLLDDVKAYLDVAAAAARLAADRHRQHRLPAGRAEPAAVPRPARSRRWDLDLEPRPATSTTASPSPRRCRRPGAYLLTAQMDDGNTSRIVVWLADTAIVKKPLDEQGRTTSSPTPSPASRSPQRQRRVLRLAAAPGRRQERVPHRDRRRSRARPTTDGQVMVPTADLADAAGHITSGSSPRRTAEGRLRLPRLHARSGAIQHYDPAYNQVKVFTITDRPVYRPGQPVQVQVLGAPRPVRPARRLRLRRQAVHGRDPQSQGREGLRPRRSRPTPSAASTGRFALPSDATLGRLPGLQSPTTAAARSASRSTRSPSSR